MVSMTHDYYRTTFPDLDEWIWVRKQEYDEAIRKAKELDELTKQKDCVDPSKEAFYKQVLERLEKLEKKNEM